MIYTTPRQREFGLISDIYHSGVKRTYRKTVGKVRKSLAKEIADGALRDKEKYDKISSSLDSMTPVNIGPKRRKYLYLEVHKRGAGVVSLPGEMESRYNVNPKSLPEISKRAITGRILSGKMKRSEAKKFLKRGIKAKTRIKEGRYPGGLILHHGPGDEILAHEIGHLGNRYSNNPITKAISWGERNISHPQRGKYTIGNGILTKLRSKLTQMEENNASKRGLRLLKKAGVSEKEVEKAKKSLDLAGKTYKLDGNRRTKEELSLAIATPDQRIRLLNEFSKRR